MLLHQFGITDAKHQPNFRSNRVKKHLPSRVDICYKIKRMIYFDIHLLLLRYSTENLPTKTTSSHAIQKSGTYRRVVRIKPLLKESFKFCLKFVV